MATRRPRVKVAANLSIRRPPKANVANVAVEPIKQDVQESAPSEPVKQIDVAIDALPAQSKNAVPDVDVQSGTLPSPRPDAPSEEPFQDFKLPKPVDDVIKPHLSSSSSFNETTASLSNNVQSAEEPTSPRKQDTRPTFTLPLARKRNRTESLTSNKSLPEGVIVNKVTRKVATKQEESQRTLDNKKEIRKRLTNIENVDKQNLTMFDMIYYNPVNNPMTPPALSKRGSLENIPNSVDGGREKDGVRSRSVSKSRSPTPAPSGLMAAPVPKLEQAPVQLTPQLKLGPNGEMILDEASLVIENEREREMRETLAKTDIVYQDEFSGNSGYYSRIRRTKEWDSEETIRFYRCLHTIGTDFSMMLTLFPRRSRRDLKLKFKKEERLNLRLVNKALQYPKEFNVEELRQQFAHEDEELERRKQEERERKLEALKTQQKEQLQKKLMLQLSASSNPQRKLSRSERAMVDETLGPEELKRPKRKTAPSKKRSTTKPAVALSADGGTMKEERQEQQEQQEQQSESLSEPVVTCSDNGEAIAPLDNTPKKPKRSPAPKKRATVKLDSNIVEQQEPQTQPEPISENENVCTALIADNTNPNSPVEGVSSNTSVPTKHDTVEVASANDSSETLVEEVQHQSAFVAEDTIMPYSMMPDTTNIAVSAGIDENRANDITVPLTSPSLVQNDAAEQDNGLLVVMAERKNKTVPVKGAAKKFWKHHPRSKRSFTKRTAGKSGQSRSVTSKAIEEPSLLLPDYTVVPIKKDVGEDVPMERNVASVEEPFHGPKNVAEPEVDPAGPFVLYEPAAAATYDNRHVALPIVKYQCVEDVEDNDYEMSHESMAESRCYDDANDMGDAPVLPSTCKEDDTITVITLQNLDDQTHTTCVRTDVGQTVAPTMINELTPVDIKYDEYDTGDQLLEGSPVKREQSNAVNGNPGSNVPVNVQIINYPSSVAVPSTEPIPYMVYEKLDYGSSSGTIIIPDQVKPGKTMTLVEQPLQYASPVGQLAGRDEASTTLSVTDEDPAGQSRAEQTLLFATPSYSTATVLNSPKHEMLSSLPQPQQHTVCEELGKQEPCKQDGLIDTGPITITAQQGEEEDAEEVEEEEEEENDGGFSLEDIDINSLVLVESQDSVNPNRTFYEIYVSNPDTGQLSEKPLDVPPAVIESIRSILESGER